MLKLTKEDFQKRISTTAKLNMDVYNADMYQVQDDHFANVFGEDFYLNLCKKYEEGTATDLQVQLVEILFDAIAPLAQASYLPLQPLQISDRGAHIVSTGDEKTPFEHQVKAAQQALIYRGFQAIERALRFLERHIDAPDFELWATSQACTRYKQHTLSNADEFNEHFPIGTSRRTYMALLPTIRKVEAFFLKPVLGEDYWYELKEQLKDRDVSADNQELLQRFIRPAVAHLSVANASTAEFSFSGESLLLQTAIQEKDGNPQNSYRLQAEKAGRTYLAKLKQHLDRNASAEKYATYFNSDAYTAPGAGPSLNSSDSKSYAFL